MQLSFEGSKSYWEKGTLKTIYSPRVSHQIGGQESSWQVENLQPKMKYDFNISALFRDGTTGPDQYLTTETLIEGKISSVVYFKISSYLIGSLLEYLSLRCFNKN